MDYESRLAELLERKNNGMDYKPFNSQLGYVFESVVWEVFKVLNMHEHLERSYKFFDETQGRKHGHKVYIADFYNKENKLLIDAKLRPVTLDKRFVEVVSPKQIMIVYLTGFRPLTHSEYYYFYDIKWLYPMLEMAQRQDLKNILEVIRNEVERYDTIQR